MNDMILDTVHYNVLDADLRMLVDENQKIWFVAKDIGEMLELTNIKKNIAELPKGVTISYPLETAGGVQNTTIVSEAGLYRLIFKSRKPEAEAFVSWVTEEVLPQIRKTGSYSVTTTNTQDTSLNDENNFQAAVKFSFDLAEQLGKHFSNGVLQASLLESDQRIYNKTSVHFLPEIARNEARKALPNYTFDRSIDTAFAHTLPVADFMSLTVTEIASKFNDKDVTTKVINNWLIDGGYQQRLVRGLYTKTDLSKDIAVERRVATGLNKGRTVIGGWLYNAELAKYLENCYKDLLSRREFSDNTRNVK